MVFIVAGALDSIREYLGPWLTFLIAVLTFLAFWPKLKASAIGKLTRENIRLRGIIADMTIEEEIKNVIILDNKKRIEKLEQEAIEQHRIQLAEISRHKNTSRPNR